MKLSPRKANTDKKGLCLYESSLLIDGYLFTVGSRGVMLYKMEPPNEKEKSWKGLTWKEQLKLMEEQKEKEVWQTGKNEIKIPKKIFNKFVDFYNKEQRVQKWK